MTTLTSKVLDELYEQFTALSDRAGSRGSPSPALCGHRSGLARARLFVLDEQTTQSALTV